MRYLRLFSDGDDGSRFEERELGFEAREFAPPAPPIEVSDPAAASSVMLLRFPKGWHDPAHPAPARQFMIVVSGLIDVTAGDEVRRLSSGDLILVEDTAPPGHGTTVLEDAVVAVARI